MADDLIGPLDITNEEWREYSFNGTIYRIDKPKALYYRKGGATHRIVDSAGITHCIPAPGVGNCVLRWYSPSQEVNF